MIDLALVLTLLTLISGVVVALHRFWLHGKWARNPEPPPRSAALLVEYSRSFFPVLLLVLVVRSFIFEPFRIPSGSMMPTLLQGDYIFVKKYSYGLRLPVLNTEILPTGEPVLGDVVVFRLPTEPSVNYIKRVVGLPGDTVEYSNHQLIVNGEPMPFWQEHEATTFDSIPRFVERLGEREHAILIANLGNTATEGVYHVPDGHYFMMGDNRDNSRDSRFLGPVPESHLVGEAVRVWMHMDGLEWPDWRRIGTKIQ